MKPSRECFRGCHVCVRSGYQIRILLLRKPAKQVASIEQQCQTTQEKMCYGPDVTPQSMRSVYEGQRQADGQAKGENATLKTYLRRNYVKQGD